MSSQEQAQVFAVRALAATGLMDPFGKPSYWYTYRDDTTKTEAGWRIGFAASDCLPRKWNGSYAFTCRGLSGENDSGALTDTFVTVSLTNRRWSVVGVQGNMPVDERNRVVGYSLRQRNEPSHWEFPATGYWPGPGESDEEVALWVGPYPTSAPGSTCEARGLNAHGGDVGPPSQFYVAPPRRPFEVAGWIHGGEVDRSHAIVRVKVDCYQVSRQDHWEVASDPTIIGSPGQVVGITAQLVWSGNQDFAAGAMCTATLVDRSGKVVWRGSGTVEGQAGGTRPIRTSALVTTGGRKIDAQAVGEFSCKS
jgi:hypothetical protein